MIDYVKDILGVTSADYDTYIVIICAVGVMWVVKSVIHGFYQTVLHIFQ